MRSCTDMARCNVRTRSTATQKPGDAKAWSQEARSGTSHRTQPWSRLPAQRDHSSTFGAGWFSLARSAVCRVIDTLEGRLTSLENLRAHSCLLCLRTSRQRLPALRWQLRRDLTPLVEASIVQSCVSFAWRKIFVTTVLKNSLHILAAQESHTGYQPRCYAVLAARQGVLV